MCKPHSHSSGFPNSHATQIFPQSKSQSLSVVIRRFPLRRHSSPLLIMTFLISVGIGSKIMKEALIQLEEIQEETDVEYPNNIVSPEEPGSSR
ncbi:hypothetical protein L6452_37173 [Arctium lappa]|uniref:Uncharacterized protein n=1 Tax=Arctium lappa TaxID=4217 RepID=A0ACB8Y3E6_ARCLA|nr:hypothetical protein L6452_37173 [Arctium lappa]